MRDVTRCGNPRHRFAARLGASLVVSGLVAVAPLLAGAERASAAPGATHGKAILRASPAISVEVPGCGMAATACASFRLPPTQVGASDGQSHSVGGFFQPASWSNSDWALSGFLVSLGALLVAVAGALAYYAGRWPRRQLFRAR